MYLNELLYKYKLTANKKKSKILSPQKKSNGIENKLERDTAPPI